MRESLLFQYRNSVFAISYGEAQCSTTPRSECGIPMQPSLATLTRGLFREPYKRITSCASLKLPIGYEIGSWLQSTFLQTRCMSSVLLIGWHDDDCGKHRSIPPMKRT